MGAGRACRTHVASVARKADQIPSLNLVTYLAAHLREMGIDRAHSAGVLEFHHDAIAGIIHAGVNYFAIQDGQHIGALRAAKILSVV